MVSFTAVLLQFEEHGDKTGWTYIEIPADVADLLFPGNKKAFRVKGKLDDFSIQQINLSPAGNGTFIMAINAAMRKRIGKRRGAMVSVKLAKDDTQMVLDSDLLQCLEDVPEAKAYFESLAPSHKRYFNNWITEAKTIETRTKRLSNSVSALAMQLDFGSMIRSLKKP